MVAVAARLREAAQRNRHDVDAAISDAEDTGAPRYYAVGGGGFEGLVIADKLKRFDAVMAELASPDGCRDEAALAVIAEVNRLKLAQPVDVAHARAGMGKAP